MYTPYSDAEDELNITQFNYNKTRRRLQTHTGMYKSKSVSPSQLCSFFFPPIFINFRCGILTVNFNTVTMCLPLVEACKNIGHGFIPLHEKSVKYLTGYKMIAVEYCIRPRHFILIQDFSIN